MSLEKNNPKADIKLCAKNTKIARKNEEQMFSKL